MVEVNNILMVCLGNICRSPVAEGIMKNRLDHYNLNITVDSAGTSNYHPGENPDLRSTKNALKNGIDISNLVARQFKVQDFDNFDIIYVMDEQNKIDVLNLSRNDIDKSKVKLMLTELPGTSHKNVPDPYFGDEAGFQLVFDLLSKACENVAQRLAHQKTLQKK
jgi:protein-tyrosine phosphatase